MAPLESLRSAALGFLVTTLVFLAGRTQQAPVAPLPSILPRDDPPPCGFEGNPDFYGLGIRLGVYLQWVAAFLANAFLKKAIPGTLETNCIFLLALFVATAYSTAAVTVQSAEVLVLLLLCFGFILSILTIWGGRTRFYGSAEDAPKLSLIGSFFRLALTTTISAYSVWFWFVGLAGLAAPECPAYTFILSRQDAHGALHVFYQVQSSIVLAIYGTLFLRELIMVGCFFVFTAIISGVIALSSVRSSTAWDASVRGQKFLTFLKRWMAFVSIVFWSHANGEQSSGSYRPTISRYLLPLADMFILTTRSFVQILCIFVSGWCPPIDFPPLLMPRAFRKFSSKPAASEKPKWTYLPVKLSGEYWIEFVTAPTTLAVANAACLIWAVVAIELTLLWNEISNVYDLTSTGQLIPLVIGIVSLLRLCYALTVEQSSYYVTDIFMTLLDKPPESNREPRADNANIEKPLELSQEVEEKKSLVVKSLVSYGIMRPKDGDAEIVQPLGNGYQATFWMRRPSHRRSMDDIDEILRAPVGPPQKDDIDEWLKNRLRRRSTRSLGSGDEANVRRRAQSSSPTRRRTKHRKDGELVSATRSRSRGSSINRETDTHSARTATSSNRDKRSSCLTITFMVLFVVCWPFFLLSTTKRGKWAVKEWMSRAQKHMDEYNKSLQAAGKSSAITDPPRLDQNIWGPHLRSDQPLTDEQLENLIQALLKLKFLDTVLQASDLIIGWAARNDLRQIRLTVEQFRDMILENAKTREKFRRGELDLKGQHKEARKRWDNFFDGLRLDLVEAEGKGYTERMPKGGGKAKEKQEESPGTSATRRRVATWAPGR